MSTRLLQAFALFLFIGQIACSLDYYKVLEINRDATDKDITKAFRRLSLKYHPDKNPGDQEAAQKFIEVNKAHETLTNPDHRRVYDLQGEEGLENHLKGGNTDMWGNVRRGPGMQAEIRVTMEELYVGGDREINIQKNIICTSCRGTGAKDGITKTCSYCDGRGVRLEKVNVGIGFTMQMQTTCQYCGGHGKTHAERCPTCGGRRVIPSSKQLRVDIEKGMRDGQQIVFERESEQHPEYTPGDIVITLRQIPHARFTRVGHNLYYDCPISLKEALLGFTKTVKHLDHHYTEIAAKEVVQPFSVKVIREQGMPVHNDVDTFGDMHVKFRVTLPRVLSEPDKDLLRRIFALDSSA